MSNCDIRNPNDNIHVCGLAKDHIGDHECWKLDSKWPQEKKVIELTDPMPMTINIVTPHGLVTTQVTVPVPRNTIRVTNLNEITTDELLAELRYRTGLEPEYNDCE